MLGKGARIGLLVCICTAWLCSEEELASHLGDVMEISQHVPGITQSLAHLLLTGCLLLCRYE